VRSVVIQGLRPSKPDVSGTAIRLPSTGEDSPPNPGCGTLPKGPDGVSGTVAGPPGPAGRAVVRGEERPCPQRPPRPSHRVAGPRSRGGSPRASARRCSAPAAGPAGPSTSPPRGRGAATPGA